MVVRRQPRRFCLGAGASLRRRAAWRGTTLTVAAALTWAAAARCFCGGRARQGLVVKPQARLLGLRVVTDANVPEGHKGLHGSLYGDDSEAAHHAVDVTSRWPGRLDGSELLSVLPWLAAVSAAAKPGEAPGLAVGLFAVYGSEAAERPFYVGYSRRVPDTLARHGAPGRVARIRLVGEARMWTRDRLEELKVSWAEMLGGEEPLSVEQLASEAAAIEDALSPIERQAFEERKWKMQMAMGQSLSSEAVGEEEDAAARRRAFMQAVEGDDWSAVIDGQTMATVASPDGDTDTGSPMVSPFQHRAGTTAGRDIPNELTAANVDLVLEALRPMLRADGGDIEVLGVDASRGAVMLGLLGACTTCPAAGTTMEDGIEKALYDHFGRDVVKEIVRVDAGAGALTETGLRQSIVAHLGSLEDALRQEGASATLVASEGDERATEPFDVVVAGPAMLRALVESSLAHRFPELASRLRVRSADLQEVAQAVA